LPFCILAIVPLGTQLGYEEGQVIQGVIELKRSTKDEWITMENISRAVLEKNHKIDVEMTIQSLITKKILRGGVSLSPNSTQRDYMI
jgi:hypothetical protein